jgi:hypothetical protein
VITCDAIVDGSVDTVMIDNGTWPNLEYIPNPVWRIAWLLLLSKPRMKISDVDVRLWSNCIPVLH